MGDNLLQTEDQPQKQKEHLISPNYQFNAEEMRAIRECNKESFYQRCLPLSGLLGGMAHLAVKSGIMLGNSKYGSVPKVCAAVVVGFIVGKFSYQKKCMEKLMRLPDSPIGILLRQKHKQGVQPSTTEILATTFPSFTSSADSSSDGPSSSINIDTDRPTFSGLEDTYRPSVDGSNYESSDNALYKLPPVSYDDLRKKNREIQAETKANPYRIPEQLPPVTRPPPSVAVPKNIYGDKLN